MKQMNLYDIDEAIMALIDEETGEVSDWEAFEKLEISRERKIDYLCKSIKEAPILTDAIASEIARLQEKKKSIEARAEKNKAYLQSYLGGEKYKSALFSCYYGSTKVVDGDLDKFKKWAMENGEDDFLKYEEPSLNKSAIKDAIAKGRQLPGLSLQDKQHLCIR